VSLQLSKSDYEAIFNADGTLQQYGRQAWSCSSQSCATEPSKTYTFQYDEQTCKPLSSPAFVAIGAYMQSFSAQDTTIPVTPYGQWAVTVLNSANVYQGAANAANRRAVTELRVEFSVDMFINTAISNEPLFANETSCGATGATKYCGLTCWTAPCPVSQASMGGMCGSGPPTPAPATAAPCAKAPTSDMCTPDASGKCLGLPTDCPSAQEECCKPWLQHDCGACVAAQTNCTKPKNCAKGAADCTCSQCCNSNAYFTMTQKQCDACYAGACPPAGASVAMQTGGGNKRAGGSSGEGAGAAVTGSICAVVAVAAILAAVQLRRKRTGAGAATADEASGASHGVDEQAAEQRNPAYADETGGLDAVDESNAL